MNTEKAYEFLASVYLESIKVQKNRRLATMNVQRAAEIFKLEHLVKSVIDPSPEKIDPSPENNLPTMG